MTWLKTKNDPVSRRTHELDDEIARLRTQINRLNAELGQNDPDRISSLLEEEVTVAQSKSNGAEQGIDCLQTTTDESSSSAHYNELGVRKYNFASAWVRLKIWLGGVEPESEQFTTYFAEGVQGNLPPLRKETRVARNRFMFFAVLLLVIVWTVVSLFISKL